MTINPFPAGSKTKRKATAWYYRGRLTNMGAIVIRLECGHEIVLGGRCESRADLAFVRNIMLNSYFCSHLDCTGK